MCQLTKRCCWDTFALCRAELDRKRALWAIRIIDPDTVWVNRRAQDWLGTPTRWPRPMYSAVERFEPELESADERLIAGVTQVEELVTEVKNLKQLIRHWRTPTRCCCGSVFILVLFRPCAWVALLFLLCGYDISPCHEG